MEQIVLIVHLILALTIIGLILLQQGKGADMGASFGAGASQTLFGSDGSGNVLTPCHCLVGGAVSLQPASACHDRHAENTCQR